MQLYPLCVPRPMHINPFIEYCTRLKSKRHPMMLSVCCLIPRLQSGNENTRLHYSLSNLKLDGEKRVGRLGNEARTSHVHVWKEATASQGQLPLFFKYC